MHLAVLSHRDVRKSLYGQVQVKSQVFYVKSQVKSITSLHTLNCLGRSITYYVDLTPKLRNLE